jgi:hypothetical protein
MRFAHLKPILRLGRLRLRGPRGAQDEFTLAAIAQNLRRLAKLVTGPPPLAVALAPGAKGTASLRVNRLRDGFDAINSVGPRPQSPTFATISAKCRYQGARLSVETWQGTAYRSGAKWRVTEKKAVAAPPSAVSGKFIVVRIMFSPAWSKAGDPLDRTSMTASIRPSVSTATR